MCNTVNDEGIVPISCNFPIITNMEDCSCCEERTPQSEIVWQKGRKYCQKCADLPICPNCGEKILPNDRIDGKENIYHYDCFND